MSVKTEFYDPENPKFNDEQYEILKMCSEQKSNQEWEKYLEHSDEEIWLQQGDFSNFDLQKINLWGAHLEGALLYRAHFENSKLTRVYLEGADLRGAHLAGAKLYHAHLAGAKMQGAHLEGASLMYANLKGATLWNARLEGTHLGNVNLEKMNGENATFDGKTRLTNCIISRDTYFRNTNLDSCRIDPELHSALKSNVREKSWVEWYKKKSVLSTFVPKFFWWISDYGRNTKKIILVFFYLAFLYSVFYSTVDIYNPGILEEVSIQHTIIDYEQRIKSFPGLFDALHWYIQILSFSIATMVTLGFGGINVNVDYSGKIISAVMTVAVASNLLVGYFLISVLVTRLGILFQQLAPEYDYGEKMSNDAKLGIFFTLALPFWILFAVIAAAVVRYPA